LATDDHRSVVDLEWSITQGNELFPLSNLNAKKVGTIPIDEWPVLEDELIELQTRMARTDPDPWRPGPGVPTVGACWVCFERGVTGTGRRGEPGWAAAVLGRGRRVQSEATVAGVAGGPYVSGLMALREGPLLEAAVRALPTLPDVLLVNATGRDHPRGFGLAAHLGAVLDVATVGVTHRLLVAAGPDPEDSRGATSELLLGGQVVGCWVRTRPGARPVAVHAAWRTDPEVAVRVVMAASRRARTPEPLRRARRIARLARATAVRK
jgi:deoxyribonuclease V